MAHHPSIRAKAVDLRETGRLTIDEIAARLAVSRSTVYGWVGDIPIPTTASRSKAQRRAAAVMQRRHAAAREAAYRTGRSEYPQLVAEPTFRDFVCMYVGEGSKRNHNRVALCNSDPAVIVLADRWIRRCTRRPVRYSVQVHADQDLGEVRAFWSTILDVPAAEITLQRKSNSGVLTGRRWRSRYGVLTVTTNDTFFRARLQGWIDCLKGSWV